jgi:hypothetical protein
MAAAALRKDRRLIVIESLRVRAAIDPDLRGFLFNVNDKGKHKGSGVPIELRYGLKGWKSAEDSGRYNADDRAKAVNLQDEKGTVLESRQINGVALTSSDLVNDRRAMHYFKA